MKVHFKKSLSGAVAIFIAFTLFSSKTTGQNIHDPWKINIYYSPEYASRFLSVTNDQSNIKEFRKNENGIYGYSIGLNFEKHLNDRIAFGLGARYSKRGYNKPLTTLANPANDHNQEKGSFKADLLEFPIFLDYSYVKREKFSVFLRIGPSFNYLIEAKDKTEFFQSGTLVKKTEISRDDANLNNFIMGGNLGTGAQLYLNDNVGVFVMPQFTYFFTPLRKNNPIKERLYSIGVNAGIILAF